jgi:hypothetical protein
LKPGIEDKEKGQRGKRTEVVQKAGSLKERP